VHAATSRASRGARDRDERAIGARYALDWNEQFRLSLDLRPGPRACTMKALPAEYSRAPNSARWCCGGPKFCSMHITRGDQRRPGLRAPETRPDAGSRSGRFSSLQRNPRAGGRR